ncbi:MAG: hypothetical protein KAT62_14880 [Desulfuromonadales bacterium]|nr:hypothetical protein [Desulfuromonadales bacterium]
MAGKGEQMTVRDLEKMVKAAEDWAASPEGKQVVEDAKKRVEETTAYLSAERVVDGQTLHMPMGL